MFEEAAKPVAFEATADSSFVLGSAVKHPHELVTGHYSVHTTKDALRTGESNIAAIGRRLDLDYGGIDFALLPDGRVFVFEANATMLVHRERNDGVLSHKNLHVQRIADAFENLLARRSTVAMNAALIANSRHACISF